MLGVLTSRLVLLETMLDKTRNINLKMETFKMHIKRTYIISEMYTWKMIKT